uniref:Uncharacterized protein n=1 Tax=Anguilla anguilla TaxID=7936 RepID=A0A0E9UAD4_ANGAN
MLNRIEHINFKTCEIQDGTNDVDKNVNPSVALSLQCQASSARPWQASSLGRV